MAQLSRPYQIALAVVALLGVVWAVALRSHGPGSSPSEPAPAKAATTAASATGGGGSASASTAAQAKSAAAPSSVYHGAAPGRRRAHPGDRQSSRRGRDITAQCSRTAAQVWRSLPGNTGFHHRKHILGNSSEIAYCGPQNRVPHDGQGDCDDHTHARHKVSQPTCRQSPSRAQCPAGSGRSGACARQDGHARVLGPEVERQPRGSPAGQRACGRFERQCRRPRGSGQPGRAVRQDHRSGARLRDAHDLDRQSSGCREHA